MITQKIETDPNEFEVSTQAIGSEQVVDSPIQIIEGAGDVALLGASLYQGELDVVSRIEKVATPEGETVVNLVNAVSKEVKFHKDYKTDEPRMERQPEARRVFVTGEYKPGATLKVSEEPLEPEEIVRLLPKVLTAA